MKFSFACLTAVLVPVVTLANEDQPHLVASSIAINDTNMNIPKGDIRSSSFSKVKETFVYKKLSNASDLRSEPTKLQNNKAGVDVNVNAIADVDLDNHSKVNKEEAVGITVPGAVLAAVATTADSGEEECVPPVTITNTIKLDAGNLPLSSCTSKKQVCLISNNKNKSITSPFIKKNTGFCVFDSDVPSSYWAYADLNNKDIADNHQEDHTFTLYKEQVLYGDTNSNADTIINNLSSYYHDDNTYKQDQEVDSYVIDEHRHLINSDDCSNCIDRPKITANGPAFRSIIDDCLYRGVCLSAPIGCWNVSEVTDMNYGFLGINYWSLDFGVAQRSSFNSPLGCWDTASVTNMAHMFNTASAFNQNINTWNTANVQNMYCMFCRGSSFNSPINNWDTGSVSSMASLFYKAYAFNDNINTWDTTNVSTMLQMFKDATSFEQNLCKWSFPTDAVSFYDYWYEPTSDIFKDSGCIYQDEPSDTIACQSCIIQSPTVSPTGSIVLSLKPSFESSVPPSSVPSSAPSLDPSVEPSLRPSFVPSSEPNLMSSTPPSFIPSANPSLAPSLAPSIVPSTIPSQSPSKKPSSGPSDTASNEPSKEPSKEPSSEPSDVPSKEPSFVPSNKPSTILSKSPSKEPSSTPSIVQSAFPSTGSPTVSTIIKQTMSPTTSPIIQPTNSFPGSPTVSPTDKVIKKRPKQCNKDWKRCTRAIKKKDDKRFKFCRRFEEFGCSTLHKVKKLKIRVDQCDYYIEQSAHN